MGTRLKKGICWIISLIFILAAASYGKVISVNPAASDQADIYPTIQKAIHAAEDGDEIIIQQGTYDENIVIKKSITLRGEPDQFVSISGDRNTTDRVLCRVENVNECLLANITFSPSNPESTNSVVMTVKGGNITIRDCKSEKNAAALSVSNGCKATIENSVFQNATRSGIWVADKQTFVIIRNCQFKNNEEYGVHFYQGGSGEISDSTFEENSRAGVNASGEGCRVSVNGSRFANNPECGVHISENATGEILNCEFNSNRYGVYAEKASEVSLVDNCSKNNREHGVYLFEVGKSQLIRNRCESNGRNGIYIQHGNRTAISQNRSLRNGRNGFSFLGKSLAVEMIENVSKENEQQGIYVGRGVEGNLIHNESSLNLQNGIYVVRSDVSLRKNLCQGNGYSGICVKEGSMGHIQNNLCRENQTYGIAVWDAFSVPVCEDNVSENNQKKNVFFEEPVFGRVREMMLNGEYDKLDSIAAGLIKEETRNEEATWQLTWFHLHLTDHWADRTIQNRQRGFAAAEKWAEHSPDSQTPSAVLAALYTHAGWDARGIGTANTVTAEGWHVFYEQLHKALEIAEKAERREIKNPEFYNQVLIIGRGLGKPKDWMQNVFDQGVSIKKDYQPLYRQLAEHLLPKWQGSSQEVRAFANSTIEPEQNNRSHMMYAFIMGGVWVCESADSFLSHGFDYGHIKKGFEQILSRFPDSTYSANRLCMFACLHGDQETARRLFPAVEKKPISPIWKNDTDYFERCKAWAFSEDKTFEE